MKPRFQFRLRTLMIVVAVAFQAAISVCHSPQATSELYVLLASRVEIRN
jgi:hypothetical protein